jgi:SAM-dependent methyltransferase
MDRHGWDERYAGDRPTFVTGPNRLVEAEVGGLGPGQALDLATGEGRHARWLAGLGWRVVAVDFSTVGLAKARAAAQGAPIGWVAADVHLLPLPPARFDLVLASFFHPRPDERAALYAKVRDTLVPGGTFLSVSYDVANLTEGRGGPQDPDVLIRPAEVAAALEAAGLRVVRAETVRLRVPTPEGEADVVDAVIRAERPVS